MHETPEGYLVCVGVPIARTGEMVYGAGETPIEPGPDGRVVIQRDAEEVFRPETIASFEGKSFTVLHPKDFVDPSNWKELTNGLVQNVRRGTGEQENDLVADILVTDAEAIKLVKDGVREVSCGYDAEYIETGKGRGVQKNIVGNHVALVDEGRAGTSYAINDHKHQGAKRKGSSMKLGDKIKAIFAKAQDEALKVAETTDENTETPEEKKGFVSFSDLQKCMDDLKAFMGEKKKEGADASTQPTESTPAEVVAKDEEVAPGLEARLKKLEDMVAKMMASQAGDEDVVTDADEEEGEESEDAYGEEEGEMVGDTASRVEILAPGMAATGKNVKAKAILAAYASKDGKAVVEQFTDGKAPNVKDAKTVDALFIGVSEVLKTVRTEALAKSKVTDFQSHLGQPKGAMTAEKMNELNAKHYSH